MSQRDLLLATLGSTDRLVDNAHSEMDRAGQRSAEAIDLFVGLGGSAGRAQAVHDLIEELLERTRDLSWAIHEATMTIQEVGPELTPEESANKLLSAGERLDAASAEIAAASYEVSKGALEVQEHLRGSAFAREIASVLDDARSELDEAATTLSRARQQAAADSDSYRSAPTTQPRQTPGPDGARLPRAVPAGHVDRARASALAAADQAQAEGRDRGTAESIVTSDGRTYAAASGRPFPVHDHEVRAIIDTVPVSHRPEFHGYCALPQCIEEALNDGVDVRGAALGAAAIRAPGKRSHGKHVAPCISCKKLVDHYGLREAR